MTSISCGREQDGCTRLNNQMVPVVGGWGNQQTGEWKVWHQLPDRKTGTQARAMPRGSRRSHVIDVVVILHVDISVVDAVLRQHRLDRCTQQWQAGRQGR